MKLLLFSAFCIFTTGVFAQAPKNNSPHVFQLPDTLKKFKGNNSDVLRKQLQEYLQKKNFQNNLLGNKQGNVAILPQDQMPCVVPDTNGIVQMPNAWNGLTVPYRPQFHPIPNPALPPLSFRFNALDNRIQTTK